MVRRPIGRYPDSFMLAQIRRVFANSWVARIAAVVLAVAFGAWGIQGALFGGGNVGADDVATVAGQGVSAVEFDNAYERQLEETAQQMARQQGGPPDPSALPPEMKREIGGQVLRQLVTQRALVARGASIGLRVPDGLLRQTVYAIPAFQGPDGQFDRQKFDQVLQASRLTEPRLLSLVRDDLMSRGLMEPVRGVAVASQTMVRTLFDFIAETRTVELARVPFASMPSPPEPTPAVLHRFYRNHPDRFTSPEYRKIRTVVLSPETVAKDVTVPEAAIKAAYAQQAARLFKPARRSVQVVTVASQAKANGVAALWRGGAQWASVRALADADGGTAVSLADATEREFPTPALGHAVFAATEGAITDPVNDGAGWVVLRVIGSAAASGDYASERGMLREQLAEHQAASAIQDRVDRLQDAIAGGGLDKIPADLGAVAAEGTLDARGQTAAGEPAPLPGSDALKAALIAHAFAEKPGTPPSLISAPDGSYYAVEVEGVTPPRRRTFDEALDDVISEWHDAALRHEAEERATSVYVAAAAAHSLDAAAAKAGLEVARPAPFARNAAPGDVPLPIVRVAFGLAQGTATMVQTGDGFAVGVVTGIGHPQPAAEGQRFEQVQNQMKLAVANDLEESYAGYVVREMNPKLNEAAVTRVLGQ